MENLKLRVFREANEKYEKFIKDTKRDNSKVLCINSYEEILLIKRRMERELLNIRRNEEVEKNRPPQKGWYMGHGNDFYKEVYRNRVDLRPRNSNKEYL